VCRLSQRLSRTTTVCTANRQTSIWPASDVRRPRICSMRGTHLSVDLALAVSTRSRVFSQLFHRVVEVILTIVPAQQGIGGSSAKEDSNSASPYPYMPPSSRSFTFLPQPRGEASMRALAAIASPDGQSSGAGVMVFPGIVDRA
jgi:hypothetical protein